MPTAVFDPDKARVNVRCDSSDWAEPTDRVTFWRRTSSSPWEVLPGYESVPAVGSYALAIDQEMPLDSTVTYRVTNRQGVEAFSTATVSTTGAEWGLWMKIRNAHAKTQRVNWSNIGALTEDALGGLYQIHGGLAVAQFDGSSAETVEIDVWVEGRVGFLALKDLLKTDKRVFLQTAEPKELDDAWWYVERVSYTNPDQRTADSERDIRYATLTLRQIQAPAGALGGATGQSYTAVRVTYGTYDPITDSGKTYWQVREGS